jgi:hypothetical protein
MMTPQELYDLIVSDPYYNHSRLLQEYAWRLRHLGAKPHAAAQGAHASGANALAHGGFLSGLAQFGRWTAQDAEEVARAWPNCPRQPAA